MIKRLVKYVVASVSLLVLLSACDNESKFRIGVSQCSDDDWRQKMNGELEREMMFHPEATMIIRSADDRSSKQIEDIDYFIESGVDLLVVAPNEADSVTPAVKAAFDKGIPVIIFDRKIHGDSFTAYQGADNEGIGRMAARHLASKFPNEPKILEIYGLPGSTPAIGRHDGFIDGLESNLDTFSIITVNGEWNSTPAYNETLKILREHPDIDVIYAHNDRMAIAASEAAAELGLRPYIIGIDAAPYIGMKAVKDNVIDATFFYPSDGARIVNTALAILNGEEFEKNVILPSASVVTKDNIDILLAQQDELDLETHHLELLKAELDDYWAQHSAQSTLLVLIIVILLLAFVVIFIIIRTIWLQRSHHQVLASQNLQLERQTRELQDLNRQLYEATQSKLIFFTNVSHDLRTPLSLISEPVNEIAKSSNLTENEKGLLRIAEKNIRILKRLINQILDFRKYENDKLQLNLSEIDLIKALTDWMGAFESTARHRHIQLLSDFGVETLPAAVDDEKIERVLFNLLSNAFKYSPDNSVITVGCRVVDDAIVLSVKDTGRGISEEDIKNIFDIFFQTDNIHPDGSGIGLSLVKAFVEMHGGDIKVESKLGKGSEFIVTLPLRHVSETTVEAQQLITRQDVESELETIDSVEVVIDNDKPLLLVIDDNEDIHNLIRRMLSDEFNVLTACDGRAGVKAATKYVPDVIVCDVMMPVMDGLECTKLLKNEVTTSHIPILMLTACSMDEQRIEGLESGADGYISKPFNMDLLRATLHNLIKNRRIMKNLWQGSTFTPSDVPVSDTGTRDQRKMKVGVSDINNEFYTRFVELVEKNIGDTNLNVENIASEMGLARSQFYRKIKAITNFSPVELLRIMRLKRARQLLTTTEKSISEIGYEVGFGSAAYFSKCFHDEFGETPSQLRERLGHK